MHLHARDAPMSDRQRSYSFSLHSKHFYARNARLSAALMFSFFSLDSNQGAEEGQNGWTAAKGRCLCRNSSIISVAHCLHLSLRLCKSLYLHSAGVMIALLHRKIFDKWMAMYMTI